jgi:hypothetical protein
MSGRRSRSLFALVAAFGVLVSAVAHAAGACERLPLSRPAVTAGDPCTSSGPGSCCTSACMAQAPAPIAFASPDAIAAQPALVRAAFPVARHAPVRAGLRLPIPPPERPPAIRFSVLRL